MSAHLRKRLAQLDARIFEQKRVLDQLQQTRSDVQRELHATATYPILTLPTKITAEIFWPLPSGFWFKHRLLHLQRIGPDRPLRRLSSVEKIAFATPILRSEVDIWVDAFPDMQGHIERWFTHAGNYRLSLGLSAHRAEMVSRLRAVIHCRWSHRVEYIRLDIRHHDIHLLRLDSVAFLLLKGATLHCTYGQDLSDLPRNVFDNAPQLYDLHLLS